MSTHLMEEDKRHYPILIGLQIQIKMRWRDSIRLNRMTYPKSIY